jgi:hypothetical protein
MTKAPFRLPNRSGRPAAALEQWVSGETPETAEASIPGSKPKSKGEKPTGEIARLTIDLPVELHTRFKAACARNRTRMVDEVRGLIEEWTQKHG